MSESLAGGLVPLGARAGSGSVRSSTLSGGLVPLGNSRKARGTATLGRLGSDDHHSKDQGATAWDEQEDEAAAQEGVGSDGRREKKGKKSSSSRGDASKKRSAGSSRSGGERRSSRSGRSDAPTPVGAGGNSSNSSSKDREKNDSSKLAAEPEEDDSYLFMGATAGARGRKSGGGAAEAAALLLDSDDSFGLPKKAGGRKLTTEPEKIETKGGAEAEDGPASASTNSGAGKSDMRETDREASPTVGRRGRSAARSNETHHAGVGRAVHAAAAEGRKPPEDIASGVDPYADFDSSVDEADALLKLTDPVAFSGNTPATPPLVTASTRRGRSSRGRRDNTSPASPDGQPADREATPSWRSPSPPSTPRRDRFESPERSPRRLRNELGLAHGGVSDDLGHGISSSLTGVEIPDTARIVGSGSGMVTPTGAAGNVAEGSLGPAAKLPSRDSRYGRGHTSLQEGGGEVVAAIAESSRAQALDLQALTIDGSSGSLHHSDSGAKAENGDARRLLTAAGPGIAGDRVPRKSSLAQTGKPRSQKPKPRGVTFDDDLGDLDALDILPSSDDDGTPPGAPAAQSLEAPSPSPSIVASSLLPTGSTTVTNSVEDDSSGRRLSKSLPIAVRGTDRRGATSITEGLSPAAAKVLAGDSSSDEMLSGIGALASPLGTSAGKAGAHARLGLGPEIADGDGDITDVAKLDLALGFTPSAMDGGRRPRRALPTGRRRRSRVDVSPTTEGRNVDFSAAANALSAPSPATPVAVALPPVPPQDAAREVVEAGDGAAAGKGESAVDGESSPQTSPPSLAPLAVMGEPNVSKGSATTVCSEASLTFAADAKELASSSDSAKGATKSSDVGAIVVGRSSTSLDDGRRRDDRAATSNSIVSLGPGRVDASVFASLERQLELLANDREAAAARFIRDEARLQGDCASARAALSTAEARAFDAEAALAEARARIRQLEAEAAEHNSLMAALESRAASDLRMAQASCLAKISDSETRHQGELRTAETRHGEALAELKRLHREELEDARQRHDDSTTLEVLAGQVQASAGAMKLLQAEMVERKGVSEVSREGQMDARERLVKELEDSARRAKQTAADEVQRLQGTLMAMDQVMRALRGQNAGERERLRQEHLRMEALQGSLVAEVEAVRNSVDEERQRLAERCAALDEEKRQAEAASRNERDQLAEQRLKLETERKSFSALQVSALQAAEEIARRQASEEGRLKLARQSLEREASSLEARLAAARADLREADHVRASLDRLRDDDELERRRLKAVAGELERCFEEVRTRVAETEELRLEAETARTEAAEAVKATRKDKESVRRLSIQVEEAARRQEAERTSTAQARAQAATELSTSRRLKSELARAFALQQRQAKGATSGVFSHAPRHSGGDLSAGVGIAFDRTRRGGDGASSMPNIPAEAMLGPGKEAPSSYATFQGTRRNTTFESSPENAGGLPFTGIAAAEATLQAVSSEPPFPGLDVGRELGRLAQRAADLRECTREQSAFLSSSRAARFHLAHDRIAEVTSAPVVHSVNAPFIPAFPFTDGAEDSNHIDEDVLGHRGRGWMDYCGVGDSGCGMSSSVLEELEVIERACAQRSTALKQDEEFVDTLGQADSPVAVPDTGTV